MSGLYDRLQDQLGDNDDQEPTGLSPLDLLDLPDSQRKVMSFVLRGPRTKDGEVAHAALEETLDDVDDLEDTITDLVHSGWLIAFGEGPHLRYRVNFRRKRGSHVSFNMWETLFDSLGSDS